MIDSVAVYIYWQRDLNMTAWLYVLYTCLAIGYFQMEKKSNHIRKIAIVYPESTGKSTLTEALAKHFNEPFVTEIARNYVSNLNRPYQLKRYHKMAELQPEEENKLRSKAKQFLFYDTTLLVHKIWASLFLMKFRQKYINCTIPKIMIYILLLRYRPSSWTFDPLREHPNHRGVV